jgi:8-oxo-dGTP diphosphatase
VITVAAAVIVRDGKILIGQRPIGEWGALKWEFPGGKLEPGEDSATALKRELREELDIDAEIEPAVEQTDFQYADTPPVRLIFHPVLRFSGEPRNLAFAQIVWEAPERLEGYDFLEADKPFVKALAGRTVGIAGLSA